MPDSGAHMKKAAEVIQDEIKDATNKACVNQIKVIFLARHSNFEQDNEIHDIYVSVRPEPGEVLSDVTFVACLVAVRIEREHGEPQKMLRDILVSTDSGQVACTVDGSLILLESIVRCEPRTIRT